MKTSPIVLILMVSLVVSVGCAKPDWIQQTLVTVDVTGTWQRVSGSAPLRLDLEQQGPKVKGTIVMLSTGGASSSLPLDGTVTGDVFNFGATGQDVKGEATVSGEEMTVRLHGRSFLLSGDTRIPITLQRVNSSAPPRPQ